MKPMLRAILAGALLGSLVLMATTGFFIGVWGWQRFLQDFWPLDSSRVGPNLVASVVTIILVTAHNEYRVVRKDEEHHASLRQTTRDAIQEVLHPVETAEQNTKGTSDA